MSNILITLLILSVCFGAFAKNASQDQPINLFGGPIVPEKSNSDKEFIEILSKKLFELKKLADFTTVPEVSRKCQQGFVQFLSALEKFELWALKMYDANGQISSGVLSGNVNNFGDFEGCLSVDSGFFVGKHCTIELQPHVTESAPYMNHLRRLAQSFDIMKSTLQDPAHVFGRFSTIFHGFCIPSTCSHVDAEKATIHFIEKFVNGTGIRFDVHVTEKSCQIKESSDVLRLGGGGEKLLIIGLIVFCILTLIASMTNDKTQESLSPWVLSFSMNRNWRQLTSTHQSSNDIRSIHGIRFLNAILIFLCHKTVDSLIPKLNRVQVALEAASSKSLATRMCALYTDAFLMLSGVLVAYSLSKRLQQNKKINFLQEVILRYVRVIPNIVAIMLITIYILPPLAPQSSQRPLVIEKPAQLCQDFGWRNLLMIQNWFQFEEMCNLHSHHVASDFELFLVAPFLVTIMWKFPKKGVFMVVGLGMISTIARFYVTFTKELMYFVPFGASLTKLVDTANFMYILPTHRFTVYGIGLLLGFVLRKYDGFKLSKRQYVIGQVISGSLITTVIAMGLAMISGVDVEYNVVLHSFYAAFAPIFYCLHVAWIIFASHQGFKSPFTSFIEWRGFAITTKFCYAFYLVQVPLFQLFIAKTRDIRYHTASSIIDLNEIVLCCLAAVVMTLFIEAPFNNLKKLLFSEKTVDENSNEIDENKTK